MDMKPRRKAPRKPVLDAAQTSMEDLPGQQRVAFGRFLPYVTAVSAALVDEAGQVFAIATTERVNAEGPR